MKRSTALWISGAVIVVMALAFFLSGSLKTVTYVGGGANTSSNLTTTTSGVTITYIERAPGKPCPAAYPIRVQTVCEHRSVK
jgi:hypothetical protein